MSSIYTSIDFDQAGMKLAEYTLESLDAAVVVFDRAARAIQWNSAAPQLLGVGEGQMVGRRLDELGWITSRDADTDPQSSPCPIWNSLTWTAPSSGTVDKAVVDGAAGNSAAPARLEVAAVPIQDEDDSVIAVMASFLTATDDASGAPPDSMVDAVTRFDYSLLAGVIVDESGRIVDWNQRTLGLTGLTEVDMVDRRFDEMCDLDTEWIWHSVESGAPITGRTWVIHRDGSKIPVVGNFRQVADKVHGRTLVGELLDPAEHVVPDPCPPGLLGRTCFDHSTTPSLAITHDGEIVEANARAESLLGRSQHELHQEPVGRYVTGLGELHPHAGAASRSGQPVDLGRLIVTPRDGAGIAVTAVLSAMKRDVRWPILLLQLTPER